MLGIKVAPSTVWEILKQAGPDPAPERASTTWAAEVRRPGSMIMKWGAPLTMRDLAASGNE
ncbi:hypothetical protein OIE66_18465 [Nonomuraea sp. NBC_01738]|uniref:hypothetical protein n=1 Tax=Nonomuraea sp. NBC_01738 TaxID=2976003 RepID=UPI002E12E0C3|nr:hypothetical protein OIE66_18465 [Nonomuraea sp. NBC_01738]